MFTISSGSTSVSSSNGIKTVRKVSASGKTRFVLMLTKSRPAVAEACTVRRLTAMEPVVPPVRRMVTAEFVALSLLRKNGRVNSILPWPAIDPPWMRTK
jgi:hypothetical protein